MQHDRSKLPKWAQQDLERLERDLAHAQNKLTAGPEDSNTFADPYADAPRPLGKGAIIEFSLGERSRIRTRIEHDHKGNAYVEVNGDDLLTVEPRSGNAIRIRLVDR
jgi:hypothetical protein